MSQFVGADADALDAAANQLESAADELDGSASGLASNLGALRWIGDVAIRFSDVWNSLHNPRMVKTSGFLREAAQQLHEQAAEQRRVSQSDGSISSWLGDFDRMLREELARLERQRALADELAAELQRMRGLTPEEQLAWWNSLSDEQRAALLAMRPGELTALNGLPVDVLLAAQANYTSQVADELQTSSAGVHGEVEVKVLWARAGAEVDAELRKYKDGHVELDLSGALKAGVGQDGGAADVEALLKAGLGGTFEFANEAEAQKFLTDLGIAAATGGLLGFLHANASHLGSVSASVGVEASASAGGVAGVGASAGVTASVDTSGDDAGNVTLSAEATVSGDLKGGVMGVSGEVSVKASATFDGTTPTEMTFEMSYKDAALGGEFTPVSELSTGATSSGHAEITFDLTQPELRAAATAATEALKRGDVAGATQALAGVMDRAQIVVRQEVGTQSTAGFDVKVPVVGGVKAEVSTNASVTTSTFVKPPGGTFYEVK